MIDDYAAAIRDGSLVIRSANGISEAMSFETKPDGKMGAAEGCHDGEVMADAICLQMHLRLPHAVDYSQKIMVC